MLEPILPADVPDRAAGLAQRLAWSKDTAIAFVCRLLEALNEHDMGHMVALQWRQMTGKWPEGFEPPLRPHEEPTLPTPGPWATMHANVYRVVAPTAPHQNKPEGICPPYPYAIVCMAEPGSVGGPQAAANAKAIAWLPELAQILREYKKGNTGPELAGRTERALQALSGL